MRKQNSLVGLLAFGLLACGAVTGTGCASSDDQKGTGTASAPNSGGNGDGPGEGLPSPKPDRVGCAQDEYTETLPTNVSLDGLTFSSAQAKEYLLDALEQRFPLG